MTTTLAPGTDLGQSFRGEAAVAESSASVLGSPSGWRERFDNPVYAERVLEAAELFTSAVSGNRLAAHVFTRAMHGQGTPGLRESHTTSDFPILFGDYMTRTLAQSYEATPTIWQTFAQRITAPDFRQRRIVDVTGGMGILPLVAEREPYKQRSITESQFAWQLQKRGALFDWTWEMQLADEFGIFQGLPGRLGVAARRTEDYVATAALIDTDGSGPAAFLGTPGTLPLTRGNLQAAMLAISVKRDSDGYPIFLDKPILMVPEALAMDAQNIVNTVFVETTVSSVATRVNGNGLQYTPTVVVNPFLTIANSSNKAPATWFLLPASKSARPAVYQGFLAGYETPDLRYNNVQGQRPGGGSIAPAEGSFENDTITYRERHVVSGSPGFGTAAYVSEGS